MAPRQAVSQRVRPAAWRRRRRLELGQAVRHHAPVVVAVRLTRHVHRPRVALLLEDIRKHHHGLHCVFKGLQVRSSLPQARYRLPGTEEQRTAPDWERWGEDYWRGSGGALGFGGHTCGWTPLERSQPSVAAPANRLPPAGECCPCDTAKSRDSPCRSLTSLECRSRGVLLPPPPRVSAVREDYEPNLALTLLRAVAERAKRRPTRALLLSVAVGSVLCAHAGGAVPLPFSRIALDILRASPALRPPLAPSPTSMVNRSRV
jgi:hypothetical protein